MTIRHLPSVLLALTTLAPLAAGQAQLLYQEASGYAVHSPAITADGRHVVYGREFTSGGGQPMPLLSSPLDSVGAPATLAADVLDFEVSAQGAEVFFTARLASGDIHLLRAPASGSGPALDLTPDVPTALSFVLGPADERVAYSAWTGAGPYRLFCGPADGSAPAVVIDGGLNADGGRPPHYRFSPDGARVVFQVRIFASAYDLYSVPSDGSAPPVLLYHTIAGDLFIGVTLILTESGLALFEVVPYADPQYDFYSVPVDGSAAPLLLTPPFPTHQANSPFWVSPDGAWLVYSATRLSSWQEELLIVPTDGSASPRRLSGEFVAGGALHWLGPELRFTPDSNHFVYVASQEQSGRYELYSAAVDGNTPPVKLNATLPALGDVEPFFALTADAPARVVYRADQALDELQELWSVPADGSAPPRRLNTALPVGGLRDVFHFALGHDRRTVLYVANEDSVFAEELHAVPSDGRHGPERLSSLSDLSDPFLTVSSYAQRAGSTIFLRSQRAGIVLRDFYGRRGGHGAAR
jgi:Tol biopolymer transport system component